MKMNGSHLKRYLQASVLITVLLMGFLLRGGKAAAISLHPHCTPSWQDTHPGNNNFGGNGSQLFSVAAISPSSIWAVGRWYDYQSQTGYWGLIEYYNGFGWSIASISFQIDLAANDLFPLYGVAGSSTTDVWAVGTQIVHWDGKSWRFFANPGKVQLDAVVALSPQNAWAAGGSVIEHWDGKHWSVVANPSTGNLAGLAALSANDIWAVGTTSSHTPQTLHWDGSSWSIVANPGTSSQGLAAVTALASNNVWAAGGALIEHWDGMSWSIVPSPTPPGGSGLTGIAAASANDIWAAGTADQSNALAEHWDGTQWTLEPIPPPQGGYGPNDVYGITSIPSTAEYMSVGDTTPPDSGGNDTLAELYTC